jgi:hypothetical protein
MNGFGTSPRTVPRAVAFEGATAIAVIVILGFFVYFAFWRNVARNPNVPEAREVVAELTRRKRQAEDDEDEPEDEPAPPAEKVFYLKIDTSRANPMTETEAKAARKQGYEVIEG